ncbi:hypothetical protein R3P38DRAFT_3396696 [Favolaschia claudopus]|uniref:Ricin B lectin domain-containing protein n=1 Tax=Favolaschia claudopus TaxID=2862362 RepID=A0AAW0BAC5_9AGAR
MFPNFQGAGVSIIAGSVEWGVSAPVAGTVLDRTAKSNTTAEWHVEQIGEAPSTYLVSAIDNNDLAVGVGANGVLTLEQKDSNKPATQMWTIMCDSCSSGASTGVQDSASGCKIMASSSGLCAAVEHAGTHLATTECAPVVAQTWDFWTASA